MQQCILQLFRYAFLHLCVLLVYFPVHGTLNYRPVFSDVHMINAFFQYGFRIAFSRPYHYNFCFAFLKSLKITLEFSVLKAGFHH